MLFQDANNLPIKFFIQKDLQQGIQAELCETITSLGGRVESKVPRQGFILVNPITPEEGRLRSCWATRDRPERYFVPYTFVEACKMAGVVLKQIFLEEDGQPMAMHIHPSIANPNARQVLSMRIMHSGGNPNATPQTAKVILADPNTDVFQHLIKTHESDPTKYIESFLWVKKCIDKGAVMFTPMVYKNPGGRRPGEERTQFTEDDEERLCRWIADKIPFKETGGRTGNRLYQQLVEQVNDPEYTWVSRHTWQSWRERYKKNAARLDLTISRIVQEKQPAHGEKGQYGYVRQSEEKPKRSRKKRKADQMEDSFGMEAALGIPGMHHQMDHQSVLPPHPFAHIPPPPMGYPMLIPGPSGPGIMERLGQEPTREEVEETEEPEWHVRIGNEPPPSWARGPGMPDDDHADKRRRTELEGQHIPGQHIPPPMSVPGPSQPGPQEVEEPSALTHATVMALASLHVIDHSLREIAHEFRFTFEEVKEHYDKCGEMTQTRQRFQQMREVLQERFGN